eukprot:COSAG05_NODE_14339_length_399_cov_1.760000_1_plen_27_part_10
MGIVHRQREIPAEAKFTNINTDRQEGD